MIRFVVINKYLCKQFFQVVMNTIFIFCCLAFIMNLFEEINFFKDLDNQVYIPLLLTSLKVPSLLHEMLPFIVLISGIWFFLKIRKNDEITAMKISGMSNFSVIIVPSVVAILLGIFFIGAVNPVTSVLSKKYEIIKSTHEKDKDYLAAITKNGIWIKEKNNEKNNIIRAEKLKSRSLINLTIYEFDKNSNFLKRIDAKSADISSYDWLLKNVTIRDADGRILSQNIESINYKSIYDLKKLKTLYSNLDTISFWNIENEIELLEERGYSSIEMRTHLQRSLAFPFFLLAMLLLSGVFTLGTNIKENNWSYIFITIITCVLVYFFNDFSAALGKTERLTVEAAVWMPILIIFIFSAIGVIYANQK